MNDNESAFLEVPAILGGEFFKIVSRCDSKVITQCRNCPSKIQGDVTLSGNFIKHLKINLQILRDQPLEVFGVWQIEDYVPPATENGMVPRNEYGNVELFQSGMLPKGTVHLQLPGLNKLARRMNIDCAPAMVGFDFHSGWNHHVFDGYVVCEEHSENLIAAWYLEQEEQEKREQKKLEKRVYGKWKKLIKGLLIRERLKARYDFGIPSQAETATKKRKSEGPKLVTKKRRICSENESDSEGD